MILSLNYKVIKQYSHEDCDIEFWDNGIVYFKLKNDVEVTYPMSVANYKVLKDNYQPHKKFYILVESGKDTTITKEAREFSSRPETNAFTKAVAVVTQSMAQRMVINVIISFIRKQTKMKAFSNREEALKWLEEYKRSNGD